MLTHIGSVRSGQDRVIHRRSIDGGLHLHGTDTLIPVNEGVLMRKASCACGGGCPMCLTQQAKSNNLNISQPNDPAEIEADQIAERVMRIPVADSAPHGGGLGPLQSRGNLDASADIHRKGSACEEEEEMAAQRKALPSSRAVSSQSADHVRDAMLGGGIIGRDDKI